MLRTNATVANGGIPAVFANDLTALGVPVTQADQSFHVAGDQLCLISAGGACRRLSVPSALIDAGLGGSFGYEIVH